jgi:protein SCO1
VTRILASIRHFFEEEGFPASVLCLMFAWNVALISLLVFPASQTGLGAFAEEFRVWCYDLDPASGRMPWIVVASMITPSWLMGAFIVAFWWQPLQRVFRQPRRLAGQASATTLFVAVGVAYVALSFEPGETGEFPFPAEDLRIAHRPPALALVSHTGEQVSLQEERGNVVLLTAVYATCGDTCPMLMAQAKRAVAGLDDAQRADLRVIAVTLDPERDTTEALAHMATAQGLLPPTYRLVTGLPDDVNRVLDQMGVTRKRNPETGVIDHANLFLLIDRNGKLAYRFTLGDRQERWLGAALRLLLAEEVGLG